MLKKTACALLAAAAGFAGVASADEPSKQSPAAAETHRAQRLNDAQLDAITAGGVVVLLLTPGHGSVSNVSPTHTICINCIQNAPPTDKTAGVVITPGGKFIIIPGGPI